MFPITLRESFFVYLFIDIICHGLLIGSKRMCFLILSGGHHNYSLLEVYCFCCYSTIFAIIPPFKQPLFLIK
jgi:hypothetical protein